MECFDDDGLPLVGEKGVTLLPLHDDDREYSEPDALTLMTFAATYREVRGKLQATRVGREQKIFHKKKA